MRLKITGSGGRKEVNAGYCCCQLQAVLNTCEEKKTLPFLKCAWVSFVGCKLNARLGLGDALYGSGDKRIADRNREGGRQRNGLRQMT